MAVRAGTKNGVPVPVVAKIEVNFRLLNRGDRTNVGPSSLIFSLDPGVTRPEFIKAPVKFKDPGHDDDPVVLDIEVDSEGNCQVVNVISGAQEDVDAVTRYVNKWRFSPAQLNDKPVTVHGSLHFIIGLPETYRGAMPAKIPAPLP